MNHADAPSTEAITADERARSADGQGEITPPLPVGVAALRAQITGIQRLIERLDGQAAAAARRGERQNAKATRQMAENVRERLKVYQTLWDREAARL
jgi:hypothetical protein